MNPTMVKLATVLSGATCLAIGGLVPSTAVYLVPVGVALLAWVMPPPGSPKVQP